MGFAKAHQSIQAVVVTACAFIALGDCPDEEKAMDFTKLSEFARNYAAAWCSRNSESVASFFAEQGSLTINDGAPAVGRVAIAEVARGFMTAFPDVVVTMDELIQKPR